MEKQRNALIVGASSGIGEALARQMHGEGWKLGLAARRMERLEALARELPAATVAAIDVTAPDAAAGMLALAEGMGGVDLIVLSSGVGYLNRELDPALDEETLRTNVLGFMALAQVSIRHLTQRGGGQLAAVTSVASLRGSAEAASYAASKSFQSVYLDGLREAMAKSGLPIVVTELQPGFVDTAMMKTEKPLPPLVKKLLVSEPAEAARQMLKAIERKRKHAYITRRYGLIAFLMWFLPRPC